LIAVRWNRNILKNLTLIEREEPKQLPECMKEVQYGNEEDLENEDAGEDLENEDAGEDLENEDAGEEAIDLNDTFYELKQLIAKQEREKIPKRPRQPRREIEIQDDFDQKPQRSPSMVEWDCQ
jgi:hypothetical protein